MLENRLIIIQYTRAGVPCSNSVGRRCAKIDEAARVTEQGRSKEGDGNGDGNGNGQEKGTETGTGNRNRDRGQEREQKWGRLRGLWAGTGPGHWAGAGAGAGPGSVRRGGAPSRFHQPAGAADRPSSGGPAEVDHAESRPTVSGDAGRRPALQRNSRQ